MPSAQNRIVVTDLRRVKRPAYDERGQNRANTRMYLLYSLLILCLRRPDLAVSCCTRRFATRSTSGASASGSATCRSRSIVDGEDSIWIHAVSVGEVLTARALIAELRRRYPRLRLFLSTTTMAGQQVARRNVRDVDAVFYFPFDLAFIVRRTLDLVRPRLFVMMETEIWPNLLRVCRKRGVKTIMVNGRISSRSYPRYRLIRPFFRRVLADVDRFCMQSEESARRLHQPRRRPGPGHGHRQPQVRFARAGRGHGRTARSRDRVLRFFRISPSRPVIVAGSTMEGEEAAAARRVPRRSSARPPTPLLVLAPRHPERFGEVERLARDAGFVTVRRSELPIDAEPRADVVVLDTIGELAQLYQIAHGGVRRRQPRRPRRPQHPRAGGLRQADRVRPAHAELRGDRRRVPARTTRPSRCDSARELEEALAQPARPIRCGARASAPRRGRWSKSTAAQRTRRWPSSTRLLPASSAPIGRRAAVLRRTLTVDSIPLQRGRPGPAPATYARRPDVGAGCASRSSAWAT